MPTVFYDWPSEIKTAEELFVAGGAASEGLFTLGNIRTTSPEPGGRGFLMVSFPAHGGPVHPRLLTWLMSRVRNGAYFRVPIRNPAQLVPLADLTLPANVAYMTSGIPFDEAGRPVYFDDGTGFAWEPIAPAVGAALQGVMQVTVDMGALGPALSFGHLIGHAGYTYMAMDVTYTGGIATIDLSHPLRTNVAAGDPITLRPLFFGAVEDPDAMISAVQSSGIVRAGAVRLIEALP